MQGSAIMQQAGAGSYCDKIHGMARDYVIQDLLVLRKCYSIRFGCYIEM